MASADAPPVFAHVSPSLFTSTILFNIQRAAGSHLFRDATERLEKFISVGFGEFEKGIFLV